LADVHNYLKIQRIDLRKILKNLFSSRSKTNWKLSYTDWETIFRHFNIPLFTEEQKLSLFNLFDLNKNNYVDYEIFYDCMISLTKSQFYPMLFQNIPENEEKKTNNKYLEDFKQHLSKQKIDMEYTFQREFASYNDFFKICSMINYNKPEYIKEIYYSYQDPKRKLMNLRTLIFDIRTMKSPMKNNRFTKDPSNSIYSETYDYQNPQQNVNKKKKIPNRFDSHQVRFIGIFI